MDIKQPLSSQLKLGLHIGTWIAILLVHAFIFNRFFSFQMSLLRAMGNTIPMLALFYLNIFLVNRFFEKQKYLAYFFSVVILILLIGYLRVSVNLQFPEIDRSMLYINERQSWRIGALLTNLSVIAVSAIYQILQNRFETESRNQAIINQQNEAQLQFLRAQINPHFLFNTLNNIYSLAVVKSDKTADMVLRLSNLLRYVVYDGRAQQVLLQKEVEQIQQYIELFQMRNETPRDIQFEIKGDLKDLKLEPMILIPIVENCFKHCDFDTNDQAFAHLSISYDGNNLRFRTLNSKNDQDQQKDQVGGVGLQNIRKRLELNYPDKHRLEVEDQGDRFLVELEIGVVGC